MGFLSACSTIASETIKLIDEGIHLADALQLAGFRHVIGTLWEVSDSYCVEMARTIYETIRDEGMTDVMVCLAVHKATRKMREQCLGLYCRPRDAEICDEDESEPETHWIPYVHFGV